MAHHPKVQSSIKKHLKLIDQQIGMKPEKDIDDYIRNSPIWKEKTTCCSVKGTADYRARASR